MAENNRKTIKLKLSEILIEGAEYGKLFETVKNVNHIINIGYMFIRAYIVYTLQFNHMKKKNKLFEPRINEGFIRNAFKVIMDDKKLKVRGRPTKEANNDMIKSLKEYLTEFKVFGDYELKSNKTSYVLGQTYRQIYDSIINNIKMHYDKHLWKYIRVYFEKEYNKVCTDKDKLKEYYSKMKIIKESIYNNKSPNLGKTINKWVKSKRKFILPKTYKSTNFEVDVERNAFKYIKCMWYMNKYIQSKEKKSLQIFPLRTSYSLKHIKINTSALIEIFYHTLLFNGIKDPTMESIIDYYTKSGDPITQNKLWYGIFNLKNEDGKDKCTLKGYSFNYEIETDGYCVSLNFINDNDIKNKETKKANFKKGRAESNAMKKANKDGYEDYLTEKESKKQDKKAKEITSDKENIDKAKKKYKKLSAEEKEKQKYDMNMRKEFPYVEYLVKDDDQLNILKEYYDNGKMLFCDPGKRSLLYLMASNNVISDRIRKNIKKNNFGVTEWDNHKIMNYTNGTRMFYTKRKRYIGLIGNWKKKKPPNIEKSLEEYEAILSQYNSKSCVYNDFAGYVKSKMMVNKIVSEHYNTSYIQKLSWFGYVNRNTHETDLLNTITNEFGKDLIIVIGDWSNKGRVNFISTPNLRLKRKLAERFKVFQIDEYKTSIIHNVHHEKCKNIYVKVNKEKVEDEPQNGKLYFYKKLHSILSFKFEKNEGDVQIIENNCINRDKNSVLNMETIMKELLKSKKRPAIFCRGNSQVPLKEATPEAVNANSRVGKKSNKKKGLRKQILQKKSAKK